MNSVLKKLITAVSGLLLVGFMVTHLLGNLTLLAPTPDAFNGYVVKLHSFGPLLLAAELGLLTLFLVHIVNGLLLKLNHRGARPERYKMWKSKGGASRADWSSLSMAISGLVLLVFLVVHVSGLRFGPAEAEGYVTQIQGQEARDLHRLVVEKLSNPFLAVFYMVASALLGLHLRHGVWSAFQSLGVSRPKLHRILQPLAVAFAFVLGLGFLVLPIVIYLRSLG